jgi:endonuclease/exonuclease/phosphatase family metal-dependent hydrolase
VRIVSYNILDGGTGRADPLAEVLLAQRSDIVALVEANDAAVVDRIAMRLNMDVATAGDENSAVAILSRWPIRQTVDHAALARGTISHSLMEACIIAPDGTEWPIGVVHLPPGASESDESRRETELPAILGVFERYRQKAIAHLLVGDFNSNAPYQQIDPARCKRRTQQAWRENGGRIPRRLVQRMLDAGYVDSLRAADEHAAEVEASFTTQHQGQRVDYIFAFGVDRSRFRRAWIEKDRLAKYASDHFPVGAEID